jgi:hypothetical protein
MQELRPAWGDDATGGPPRDWEHTRTPLRSAGAAPRQSTGTQAYATSPAGTVTSLPGEATASRCATADLRNDFRLHHRDRQR